MGGGKGQLDHVRERLPRQGYLAPEGCVIMCENGYLVKTGSFEARPWLAPPPRSTDPVQAALAIQDGYRGLVGRRAARWRVRPHMPLITLRLRVAGSLAGVESRGWAALCEGLGKAVGVPSHLVSLQRARRVADRAAAPAPTGVGGGLPRLRRDAPAVELEFELTDGGAGAAASSLAVAALLSASEQRFGEQLGLPLLQMPRVRIELPPDPREEARTRAEAAGARAVDVGATPAAAAAQLVRAEDERLFGEAIAAVLRHAKQTMDLEVPSSPPAVADLMRDGAAQRRLLALLQAVLSGVETLPPGLPPASLAAAGSPPPSERARLAHAARYLLHTIQGAANALAAMSALATAPGAAVPPPLATPPKELASKLANRALGKLAGATAALDAASSGLAAALAAGVSELQRRAWAGAARPEARAVRTFVRFRPPSAFEQLWSRRCRRLAWGPKHVALKAAGHEATGVPTLHMELDGVLDPEATQQQMYEQLVEPLVRGVLGGTNGALVCLGAVGSGKAHAVFGSAAAQAYGVEAARAEWGAALRACEHVLREVAGGGSGGGGAPVVVAPGGTALHLSLVEIVGEEATDLLGGGAPLPQQADAWPGGAERAEQAHLFGAAQVRVDSLEEAARALCGGLKARAGYGGPLAPRTHMLLALTLRRASGGSGGGGGGGGRRAATQLVLAHLAGGEVLRPKPHAVSPLRAAGVAARGLAVLGTCVVQQAEGAGPRAAQWEASRLSAAMRELLTGDFSTAMLGCCGVAEGELQGTLATLQFMRHARRLQTWVRPPQPALAPLHHRLRGLQQQLSALQQPPPLRVQPELPRLEYARLTLAHAADADPPPKPPRRKPLDWFGELNAHMSTVLRHRTEQTGRVHAVLGTLRQTTIPGEQSGLGVLSWGAPRASSGGLLCSPEMLARTTAIEQQAAAVDALLGEAEHAQQALQSVLTSAGAAGAPKQGDGKMPGQMPGEMLPQHGMPHQGALKRSSASPHSRRRDRSPSPHLRRGPPASPHHALKRRPPRAPDLLRQIDMPN